MKDAAMTYTVPAASRVPATDPPTIWPCGPAREMVNPLADDGIGEEADWGIMVAEIERISKRPWKVTVAPGVVEGCRRVTLATVPEPLSTQRPILRRREKRAIASTISTPPGTSRT